MILETSRLRIIPLTIEQFVLLLSGRNKVEEALGLVISGKYLDEYMQQAMGYLYQEGLKHKDNFVWYTSWQIILKAENKSIGSACFKKEPDENGCVEIGYGIDNDYRSCGYMTEAFCAMSNWAFSHREVKTVMAKTNKDNYASQKVLQKCGMILSGESDGLLIWIKDNISNLTGNKNNNTMAQQNDLRVISVRENPEYRDAATIYIQSKWPQVLPVIYENSINHSITSPSPLPQWYLLDKGGEIIGCAGLITNDFISRMDLYPWICAVFIEEAYRGNSYGSLILEKAKDDTRKAGFGSVYLCTDHIGYYEKYGFKYIGEGYHPWGGSSRIYECVLDGKLPLRIREEKEKDFPEIYGLIKTAFETADVKDGDEQDFAVGLRNSGNYIPRLALVAELDDKLIGHIMLTKTYIAQPDGTRLDALLLAPVSVLIEYRNKGVGSALINEGFRLAHEMGYKVVFLCGDPAYYNRFGFHPVANYGLRHNMPIPDQYIMACELENNALSGIDGVIDIC